MKNLVLSVLSLAIVALLPACSKKSNNGPSTTAQVMFVHGSAAGATTINLDAEINGTKVNGATNIAFLNSSGYKTVTAGSGLTLSFFVTGLNQLASQSVNITAGNNYSAFASGAITTPAICFTSDDLSAPAAGMAKVRFVNLSPDNLTTNCFVGTTKIDSGLAANSCSSFFQVAAASGIKIGMYDQTISNNSAIIASQSLIAGKIYTFMLTGTASGSGTSIYTLTAINNN